jgi:hypothetical protein
VIGDVEGVDSLVELEVEARRRLLLLFSGDVVKWMENGGKCGGKEMSGFGNGEELVRRGEEMVCIFAGKIEFGEKREIKWKGEEVIEAGSLTLLACLQLQQLLYTTTN